VYSSVVSLQGFLLVLCLAELNELQLRATDIVNANLEAYTSEKVAGPKCGDREGHIQVISTSLYGLQSSGTIDLLTASENLVSFPVMRNLTSG
jgi:hypothetical protein